MFLQSDLPRREDWDHIFLSTIGGNDPNGRQLDGMGGGVSSLSKVCVVGPSTHKAADVDYTFAAIGVKDDEVDYSSNCGNMTSAIGPFAVDRGLVDGGEVRIHNTNTGKIIHASFPVVDGEAVADGDFAIDGVAGTGALVKLAFINPAGSKTGKLLPTGNVVDAFAVEATCIDVGNPCVFVSAEALGIDGTLLPDTFDDSLLASLDSIRRKASVAMGISESEASTPGSIPKIAIVSSPRPHQILSGATLQEDEVDLVVRAMSVGQPHRAVPITVAMAVAAAAKVEGSVVQRLARTTDGDGIRLGHSSGKLTVDAELTGETQKAIVYRTARRLFEGTVFWK